MRIPARLMGLARFIPQGSKVADIGTDHALLPIYLIRQGLAREVTAGDFNAGPLETARRNVAAAGLNKEINLKLGYGLDIVDPDRTDTVVIAGMGGATIRAILADAGDKTHRLQRLVLQPMNDSGLLRDWLAGNGWRIEDEDIVIDDGRLYEIICAVPGREETTDQTVLSVGPRLVARKHPLLAELLRAEIDRNNMIIEKMRHSTRDMTPKQRQFLERNRNLERIIKCL